MQKPSIPKGTRDFSPDMMIKRNFIFDTIKNVFKKYNFQPLETPAMENLSVLMGKYGEEGDQLLFKVLNSGDFLDGVSSEIISEGYKKTTSKISEKGLKYDLTVPFARYVVMNRNDITFPFKRYQIQPVWRGDRPQKGRYREFYQCDADVVGTDSLLCEAEIILMINEVFEKLKINNYSIKINNRKVLSGIAEVCGAIGKEADLAVAIDKLDKIGREKVEQELLERGFTQENLLKLSPIFEITGDFQKKISELEIIFINSEIGKTGLEEIKLVLEYVNAFGNKNNHIEFDASLARGLSYYTGAIFEVKALDVQIGSISGGGRYDNLTGAFGLSGVSGVGISFGVDRIYDVMDELNLFPPSSTHSSKIMIASFDKETFLYSISVLKTLRENNISAELYPDVVKMKKQLDYANAKKIPFVVVIGTDEIKSGKLTIKNMETGEQEKLNLKEIIEKF